MHQGGLNAYEEDHTESVENERGLAHSAAEVCPTLSSGNDQGQAASQEGVVCLD